VFGVIAKNILAQGFGKVGTVLLSLATTALLTRLLGLEGYGAYTFIAALVLFFGTLSDWGTNIIAVREATQQREQQPVIFGSIITFRLLLSVVAFIALNLVIRINPGWSNFVLATTVASFILFALSLKTSFTIIFHTLLKLEKSAIVEVFSSVLFLGLVFLSFLSKGDLVSVMAAWFVATMAAGALALILAVRAARIVWGLDTKKIGRIFKEALPTGALFFVFYIYNRVDTVILEHFQGSAAVGTYGLAYRVHDNLVLGAAFLMNAVFPLFSKKFAGFAPFTSLRTYYQKVFDILLIAAVLVLISTFLFAPLVVRILGGDQFYQSIGVLRILALGTFFAYFNHLTGYSLIAFGKQRISLLIAVLALSFNVLANFIFIPLYSYSAAAIITVATEVLVLLLSSIAIWKTIGMFPSLFSFPKTWVVLLRSRGKSF
tara:strand:- start:610 stop:1905 length:1296 start_codon:yes stop_codon:yes gene_type:complete